MVRTRGVVVPHGESSSHAKAFKQEPRHRSTTFKVIIKKLVHHQQLLWYSWGVEECYPTWGDCSGVGRPWCRRIS